MQLTMKKFGAAIVAAALALCIAPAMAMLTPGQAHAAQKIDISDADVNVQVVTTKMNTKTGEWKSLTNYTGKQIKPKVKLSIWQSGSYDANDNYTPGKYVPLKQGKDYTISYKNNKNIGYAQVIIKGKGAYKGTIIRDYTIRPKATKVTKVKGEKKALTVSWKKASAKQADGYVVSVYTRSKKKTEMSEWYNEKNYTFKQYRYDLAKQVVVKNPSTTSVKVKGLKSKTKYYVTVQPYKFVAGTTKDTYPAYDDDGKYTGERVVDEAYATGFWSYQGGVAFNCKGGTTK